MSDIPIADHAFLADLRTAALVTREGSVDWLALPRLDDAPVLARLLDDGAGHLLLRPEDPEAVARRRYLPHTLVLETTWTTATGTLVVEDALAVGPHERGHDVGLASPGLLLRRARCTRGSVAIVVEWVPRPEYGLVHPLLDVVDGGVRASGGSTRLTLSCSLPLAVADFEARGSAVLQRGEAVAIALEQAPGFEAPPPLRTARFIAGRLRATERSWRSWSDLHERYRGPFEDQVHRSGIVLQGLRQARTGAIAAAATTSLPEGVGTGRNWDYRFTWVRDASMTMRGLWVAACPDEASRFFAFLARAAGTQLQRGLPLQIMFGLGGERDLSERTLDHLSGWRGSRPVRVGNAAWAQRQQDVYGALLDAAHLLRDQLGMDLEPETRDLLTAAVDMAAATWQQPDQGIWEVRGEPRRFTHSAVLCWTALDRGIALAEVLHAEERVEAWAAEREAVRQAILEQAWNDDVRAFTQSFGSTALDASTLLVGLSGIVPPDDPKVDATIDAIRDRLSDGRGLVKRYADDDLEGEEGSFLLCTFWLAEAMARAGRPDEAERVLGQAAACANDLGLFSEEIEERTGDMLGNFPQAFSHLGFVLAAEALAEARAAGTGPAAAEGVA